jgi:hypothetical protein
MTSDHRIENIVIVSRTYWNKVATRGEMHARTRRRNHGARPNLRSGDRFCAVLRTALDTAAEIAVAVPLL